MAAIVGLALVGALIPQYTRRDVSIGALAAATAFSGGLPSRAVDASLTDAQGRFVVDPAKAARGLEDPLVEPDGAYSTISAALAVAPSGATITIMPGAYNERVRIVKSVTLAAEAGATLTWKTDKPYEAALTVDLSEASSAASVTVSGLSVRHTSPSIAQNYAVYVPPPSSAADGASSVMLRDCDISSASGSGVGVEGGAVSLAGCRVHDCKNHGVLYLGRGARGRVSGCTLEKNKLNGALLRDGSAPTLEANRLANNGQYGAALIDCRGVYRPTNEAVSNGKGSVSGECDDLD